MIRFSSAIFALAVVMLAFAAAQAWRGHLPAAVACTAGGYMVCLIGFIKRGDGE